MCVIITCHRQTVSVKVVSPLYTVARHQQCWYHSDCYLSAEELRGEVFVCSIWCRWKAEILVITPPPLVPSQLPFYLLLFLQSRACSSVGISVSGSSEQGSGPCQSHYITRPRYCGSAWPGWIDDHRGFVFPTFPFSSPMLLLLLPLRQTAYWCHIEGSLFAGNRRGTVAWSVEKYTNSKLNGRELTS